ncbi:MAG: acyl-CoA dehydrogenase family protein [Actinomycetota bacterium]
MTTVLGADAVIERATMVADEVLFPRAEVRDRATKLPRDGLEALAAAGLFGLAGPPEFGGLAVDPISGRRINATVGGGCGATFFVWAQHHGVVRDLATSDNTDLAAEYLRPMCSGELICGTAFAHVRRLGTPAVRATKTPGGWRLDGFAPWATSWGIAKLFSIYALADDGTLVKVLTRGADENGDPEGIRSIPLHLLMFGSTGTVALRFEGHVVPDTDVIATMSFDRWSAFDRVATSIGPPSALGIAERCVAVMRASSDDNDTVDAAASIAATIDAAWTRDGELMGQMLNFARGTDPEPLIAAASDHRANSLLLAQRAATAAIAAAGGRAMDLDHPGQRLAREASFCTIWAQTNDGRAATLRAVTSGSRSSGLTPRRD